MCWFLKNHSAEKVEIYYSLYYLGKMNIIDIHNSQKRHNKNKYYFGYDLVIIFFVTRTIGLILQNDNDNEENDDNFDFEEILFKC